MSSSRRAVLLVLLVILVAAFISGIGLLTLAGMFGAAAMPTEPEDATLYLHLRAPFDEVAGINPFDLFQDGVPSTLRDVENLMARAKVDPKIHTLVILPSASGALWGQLQEIRDAVLDFKTSGKPVTAYLEAGGAEEYFVASAADRIVMMPAGSLDLSGLATYELFFRGALDKIGVEPDLLHIGDYKTASNTFTEKDFTAAHREMSASLNREWYDQLVDAIAKGRKRSVDEIRQTIDKGPFLADEAKAAGLIDALGYDDSLSDSAPIKGTRHFDADQYAKIPGNPPGQGSGTRIALIYAVGDIASGRGSYDTPGASVIGSDTFVQWIRKVRIDPDVRAIVVRIDSPGGSAIASDVIWHELMLARAVKPLVVSMGDVAASGGYYIAVPATTIVAEPGTLTGSIGVVTGKFVVKGALEKLGIGEDSVSDGKMAEIDSPFKSFSPDEHARIDAQIHETYQLFLSRVAEGRHKTTAAIDAIGQGRVWTGRQAKENGLVDEIGGLDRAIEIARQDAHVDPKASIDLVVYPPKRGIFDLLADYSNGSSDLSLSLPAAPSEAAVIRSAVALVRLFRPGEPLMLMPDVFWHQ